jgi:hypothetical protein
MAYFAEPGTIYWVSCSGLCLYSNPRVVNSQQSTAFLLSPPFTSTLALLWYSSIQHHPFAAGSTPPTADVGATELAISWLCGLLGVIVAFPSGAIGWGSELGDLLLDKLYDAGSDFVREQKEPRHIRLGPVAGVRLEGLVEFYSIL